VDELDGLGMTCLMWAAACNQTEIVQFLLSQNATPDLTALESKATALIFAASRGHSSIVKALLERGANPDVQCKVSFKSRLLLKLNTWCTYCTSLILTIFYWFHGMLCFFELFLNDSRMATLHLSTHPMGTLLLVSSYSWSGEQILLPAMMKG
jgi:hypothetical protein